MRDAVSYMPNADQELLLKAALFDGEAALAAWNAWRKRIALDDADFASQRLLPLLLHNLERLGVDDPDLGRYRSVARHVWLENQIHANSARQVLAIFQEAQIPAMPLKGLAVTTLYYGNPKLRGMGDVDILVPFAAVGQAGQALARHGWRCELDNVSPAMLTLRHAVSFANAQSSSLDLHWHISHECCWPEADDAFWRHAQPLSFNGVQTQTLSDTDQLFHACIHGGRPCDMPPIRWVADGAYILRNATIDWQRLFAQAQEFKLVRRLQRTLGYLRETMALPIPDAVMAQLAAMKPGGLELLEERVTFSSLPEAAKASVRHYVHYRRSVANRTRDEGFLRYLQMAFGTRSFPETVLWVVRWFFRPRSSGRSSHAI